MDRIGIEGRGEAAVAQPPGGSPSREPSRDGDDLTWKAQRVLKESEELVAHVRRLLAEFEGRTWLIGDAFERWGDDGGRSW